VPVKPIEDRVGHHCLHSRGEALPLLRAGDIRDENVNSPTGG